MNPHTVERYIPREPLFSFIGNQDGYPQYRFILAPRSMFSLRPASDWTTVLRKCFTEKILDQWMLLDTKEKRTDSDVEIRKKQVANFKRAVATLRHPHDIEYQAKSFRNVLAPLKFKRTSKQYSTEDKIKIVMEEIKTFWSIVYGHK